MMRLIRLPAVCKRECGESALSHDADSDDLVLFRDVLDEVVNGRTQGHACPFCGEGPLDVDLDEGGVRIKCPSCGKFFEGRFA